MAETQEQQQQQQQKIVTQNISYLDVLLYFE